MVFSSEPAFSTTGYLHAKDRIDSDTLDMFWGRACSFFRIEGFGRSLGRKGKCGFDLTGTPRSDMRELSARRLP